MLAEEGHDGVGYFNPEDLVACDCQPLRVCVGVCLNQSSALPNPVPPAWGTAKSFNRITPVSVSQHTDVDTPPRVPLPSNQVLHPMNVVKAKRHGGDEPFQGNLDG